MLPTAKQYLELLACPACGGDLQADSSQAAFSCRRCEHSFESADGIPQLFVPNQWNGKEDVTDTVAQFYERNPFPIYDEFVSASDLMEQGREGLFTRLLDGQCPPGATILDVGCGTGQLTNFLGLTWRRTVLGIDACLNSLKLGQRFRCTNDIENAAFLQMNLFRPALKPESFDVVICSGVLHHTSDPARGFESISKLVRKGGHIIVALYNSYGRMLTHARRFIFQHSGKRLWKLDSRLRNRNIGSEKKQIWFMDQYRHPHESGHSIGDVLGWFNRCGVAFVNSRPKSNPFTPFAHDESLFQPNPPWSRTRQFLAQLAMLPDRDREGGLFVMIGRRI